MSNKQIKLFSTSTIHGSAYLEYCKDEVSDLFKGRKKLIFIPYARPSGITHQEYTNLASGRFKQMGFDLRGLHEFDEPRSAIKEADGIFTGGGNTFLLLKTLYELNLLDIIKERVFEGIPYMGSSAGSNVAGMSISTTNDMPIVYPPSFQALNLVGFNINPHYLDPDPNSTHKGETRETRIKEFHCFNSQAVVGIREGSWIDVKGEDITLGGNLKSRIFQQGKEPTELESGSSLNFLLS